MGINSPATPSDNSETETNHQYPDRDWRNSSKPRNPEDDGVVRNWRRRADGTWEQVDLSRQLDQYLKR
jgi:hypothetical protein